jgi:hypothetical protein
MGPADTLKEVFYNFFHSFETKSGILYRLGPYLFISDPFPIIDDPKIERYL